jgi:CheY-like chemotaxis protein
MSDSRIKVLLVEDDAESRDLLAELLRYDFDVQTAADGDQGLALFARERPDVVVTDEALPGMRGTLLAREVKIIAPAARVILVSGYLNPANAESCDIVLRKPVDLGQLWLAVSSPQAVSAEEAGPPQAW